MTQLHRVELQRIIIFVVLTGSLSIEHMTVRFKFRGKSNLYGRLLWFVLFMVITIIISSESSFLLASPVLGPKIGGIIVAVLMMVFLFYTIQLLKILGLTNRLIIRILYVYAVVGLIGGLYIANPFVQTFAIQLRQALFSFFHFSTLLIYLTISWYILRDIFSSKETHSDHIWGAIVVYFLAIFMFGDIYEIITLYHPGLLGQVYELGWPNYIQCITYSLNAISGVDTFYPDAHGFIKKLGVLENIAGNLFLVVILGRLLSHPIKDLNS